MNFNRIFITGDGGFVGSNLKNYFSSEYNYVLFDKINFQINGCSSIIHLAGKAHDQKNSLNNKDYYQVNTDLTTKIYDAFLASDAKVFITLSSVKAVADEVSEILKEDYIANPITHYGKSKLLAEQYILSKEIPKGKRIYILRPCMIHGPGNKGNLNLLYQLVSKGIPWPLGSFDNKRSFCSIDNLMFIIKELIERDDIPSGVYNVADDSPLSTNELITILAESQNRQPKIWKISKKLIYLLAKIGNVLHIPLNEERLHKLTNSFVVCNQKVKSAIGKPLPVSSKEGLMKTFKSFN
jgi:nucleoside-diphosphate-sugar epimerase